MSMAMSRNIYKHVKMSVSIKNIIDPIAGYGFFRGGYPNQIAIDDF